MNSLFQDGATISWLLGEGLTLTHARRSVAPERLADLLLSGDNDFTDQHYWDLTHLTENIMTDLEIKELPKVWLIGGDGALGDIASKTSPKSSSRTSPTSKASCSTPKSTPTPAAKTLTAPTCSAATT